MPAPELLPPVRVLMGPGPSDTHPRVLAALARGTVGHLDPYYLKVMNSALEQLLAEQGHKFQDGASIAAVNAEYLKAQ